MIITQLVHALRDLLLRWIRALGTWILTSRARWGQVFSDLGIGLKVLLERLKEEVSPFPPEPWRRG